MCNTSLYQGWSRKHVMEKIGWKNRDGGGMYLLSQNLWVHCLPCWGCTDPTCPEQNHSECKSAIKYKNGGVTTAESHTTYKRLLQHKNISHFPMNDDRQPIFPFHLSWLNWGWYTRSEVYHPKLENSTRMGDQWRSPETLPHRAHLWEERIPIA